MGAGGQGCEDLLRVHGSVLSGTARARLSLCRPRPPIAGEPVSDLVAAHPRRVPS